MSSQLNHPEFIDYNNQDGPFELCGQTELFQNITWKPNHNGVMIGLDLSIQKRKDSPNQKQPSKKSTEEDTEPEKNFKVVNEDLACPKPQKPTVVFVFDASSSMNSSVPAMIEALEIFFKVIIKVMRKKLRQPKPSSPEEEEDFFRSVVDVHLVIFSDTAKILYSSKCPSRYTLSWRQVIGKLRARSSTNYSAAFSKALPLFASSSDLVDHSAVQDACDFSHLGGSGVMIILTDGDPTSGKIRTLNDIKLYRKQCFPPNITTHVLGLGSFYNGLNVAALGDHFCHLNHPEAVHEAIAGICKDIFAFGCNAKLVLEGIPDADWAAWGSKFLIGDAEDRTLDVGRLFKRKRFIAAVVFESNDPHLFQRLQQLNARFVLYFTDCLSGIKHAFPLPQILSPGLALPEGRTSGWDQGPTHYPGAPQATYLPKSYQENYIHQVKSRLLASLLEHRISSPNLADFETVLDAEMKWCEEDPSGKAAIDEIRSRIDQFKRGLSQEASRFCSQSISSMRTQSISMSTADTTMPSSSVFYPDKFSRSSTKFKSQDFFRAPRSISSSFRSESHFLSSNPLDSPLSSSSTLLPRSPHLQTRKCRFDSQEFFLPRSSPAVSAPPNNPSSPSPSNPVENQLQDDDLEDVNASDSESLDSIHS